MNLTRLRRSKWNEKTPERIYQKYKSVITWGDQDIFNIFFHFHPGDEGLQDLNYKILILRFSL